MASNLRDAGVARSDTGWRFVKYSDDSGLVEALNEMMRKILVVDDEPDMVSTCQRLLKRLGYDCVTAQTVSDAIRLIDEEHPDLVVTDLNLPVGDGFEVSRHVRQNQPKTPVILITAFLTPETVGQAYANGATGYLSKPFSTTEFSEAVQRALQPA
jgi:two-component system response regulator HydG